MNLSAMILLTSLWLLSVLLIVSFLAGAKRLRGEDEPAEEPLVEATTQHQPVSTALARRAGERQ